MNIGTIGAYRATKKSTKTPDGKSAFGSEELGVYMEATLDEGDDFCEALERLGRTAEIELSMQVQLHSFIERDHNAQEAREGDGDMPSKEDECGALWLGESKDGKTKFFKGTMTESSGRVQPVVIFRNGFKKPGSNEPDYRIYRDRPRNQPAPQQGPQQQQMPQQGYGQAPHGHQNDDNVPF